VDARATGIRDASLLSVAVVLGALMSPQLAVVGLPVAAAGVAGLAYRGKVAFAAVAAALGIGAVAALQRIDVVFVAPAVVAIMFAVVMLPKRSAQVVGAVLVGVLTLASVAFEEVLARGQGTTLAAATALQMQAVVGELVKALGSSASAELVSRLKEVAVTMSSAWPATYFESAVVVGVLVIVAIAWAARRAGREVNVPSLSRLDLTPHVLWVFVVGLLFLAASYGAFTASRTLGVVGLNLVLCARTLFILQGLSVSAGLLDRTGVGLGGRILALAALAALDALTLVVSFIGLLDFWINFRRLPRDGVTPAAPTQVDA
jgi:hypothetical protein